jgi:MYXO-CTERM domain-containing protein
MIDTTEGIHIHRNQFAWYDGGQWPGIRGEYILGDLDAAHPYYAVMPNYVQALEGTFVELSKTGNCYDAEPVIASADFTQPENDITGMVPDENYEVLSAPEVEQLFGDSEHYLRDFSTGLYESCGSQVSQEGSTTEPPDGGVPDGGATTDGGTPQGATPSDPAADDGCGCRSASRSGGAAWPILALAVVASMASRRRRRNGVPNRVPGL